MSGLATRLQMSSIFNHAAYAGPRRFLIIGGGILTVVAGIAVISMSGSSSPPSSQIAKLPAINPLPGGLQSNPQLDKLALATNQDEATQAAAHGQSYTPPIAASQPVKPLPAAAPIIAAPPPPQPIAEPLRFAPAVPSRPVVQTVQYTPAPVHTVAQAAPTDPQELQTYNDAIGRLLRGWGGRSPRTDIQIQPTSASDPASDGSGGRANGDTYRASPVSSRLGGASAQARGRLLVPAGRGVFAHTILSVSSDSEGPVVLQADSGPLAGDRMIGAFGKATSNGTGSADRLVVRVNTIEHQGQSIGVDGIVTAPDTMETTVASSVDQHYLARFALPAAAAFIQGLGQALESTSNTTGVLSPLGGTSYTTQLNFPQQIGVGAGTAAAQIGNTLNREAPTGPTIHLDANVNVGVMFLADVNEAASQ